MTGKIRVAAVQPSGDVDEAEEEEEVVPKKKSKQARRGKSKIKVEQVGKVCDFFKDKI